MNRIPRPEFEHRLAQLCTRKGGPGLPRKRRDQHILLMSIVLAFEHNRPYSESEVNDKISNWLTDIGHLMETDHVTLRRHLVDEGYLQRDDAGLSYRVNETTAAARFDLAVLSADPTQILDDARSERERRRWQHIGKDTHRP